MVLVGGVCLPALSERKGKKPNSEFAFPCPNSSGLPSYHRILGTYGCSLLLGGLSREAGHVVDNGGEVGGSVEADVGQAG